MIVVSPSPQKNDGKLLINHQFFTGFFNRVVGRRRPPVGRLQVVNY